MNNKTITETGNNCYLNFRTKTRENEFRILLSDDSAQVCVRAAPENNKANMEIIKEFSRLFKRNIRFTGSVKTKQKCVIIENITRGELIRIIEKS